MCLKELQKRGCKQSHCQERKDETNSIHANQSKSHCLGACGSRHQQHAGQGRAHTWGPCKAEGKSHEQRRERRHGQGIQFKRKPPFLAQHLGCAEKAQLVQSKKHHQDASHPGKHQLVAIKEIPHG